MTKANLIVGFVVSLIATLFGVSLWWVYLPMSVDDLNTSVSHSGFARALSIAFGVVAYVLAFLSATRSSNGHVAAPKRRMLVATACLLIAFGITVVSREYGSAVYSGNRVWIGFKVKDNVRADYPDATDEDLLDEFAGKVEKVWGKGWVVTAQIVTTTCFATTIGCLVFVTVYGAILIQNKIGASHNAVTVVLGGKEIEDNGIDNDIDNDTV